MLYVTLHLKAIEQDPTYDEPYYFLVNPTLAVPYLVLYRQS